MLGITRSVLPFNAALRSLSFFTVFFTSQNILKHVGNTGLKKKPFNVRTRHLVFLLGSVTLLQINRIFQFLSARHTEEARMEITFSRQANDWWRLFSEMHKCMIVQAKIYEPFFLLVEKQVLSCLKVLASFLLCFDLR